FFFSSRRRHTRFSRDWSSDVCSSDLTLFTAPCVLGKTDLPGSGFLSMMTEITERKQTEQALRRSEQRFRSLFENVQDGVYQTTRSEERRVGKECRSRWWTDRGYRR